MDFACPNCGTDLQSTIEASLPEETDLTITLEITPGELVMAKTLAGVLENWAEMQVAIGAALDAKTEVLVAGLSYENDRISITTRIVNTPTQAIEARRSATGPTDAPEPSIETPKGET